MKKKILSIALSACLVLTIAPAAFATNNTSAADALELSKTATDNGDGSYTITLESYATAAVEGVPTDVVLLLDRSGSMYDAAEVDKNKSVSGSSGVNSVRMTDTLTYEELNGLSEAEKNNGPQQPGYYMMAYNKELYCVEWTGKKWVKYDIPVSSYADGTVKTHRKDTSSEDLGKDVDLTKAVFYKSIFGVSYDGVRTFLDEISEASNTRVAIASFGRYSMSDPDQEDWVGTGVYNDGKFVKYGSVSDFYNSPVFKSSFKSVEDEGELQELYDLLSIYEPAINQTATGAGFRIAENLFSKASSKDRNHIVVIFTDGEPTGTPSGTGVTDGMNATQHAKQRVDILKGSTHNAEVYAIGPQGGNATPSTLKYFASDPDSSYFFSPSASETADAFRQIAGYIVEGSNELNKSTAVVDEVSPYFTLPEDASADDIEVYTATHTGTSSGVSSFDEPVEFDDAIVMVDEANGTVRVSNFDYSENAVYMTGNEAHGKKLIVRFPITPNPDFLGGNNVPTNTSDSGVFNGDTAIEKFEVPKVDINVKEIQPQAADGYIYLSQAAELPHTANIGKFVVDDTTYEVDGVNNAFAKIKYTISDGTNSIECTIPAGEVYEDIELGTLEWTTASGEGLELSQVLKNDQEYTVSCSVISTGDASNASNADATAKIHVYTPVVSFKDSVIRYGTEADYMDENYVSVKWVGSDGKEPTDGGILDKLGTAPDLSFEYDVADGSAITKDTPVTVSKVAVIKPDVKPEGSKHEVPEDYDSFMEDGSVEFQRLKHDFCGFAGGDVEIGDENFIVHIELGDLSIFKEGLEEPVVGAETEQLGDDASRTAGAGESALFLIEGCGVAKNVVVAGNGSVSVKDLPTGTYKVTELTGWTWGSTLVGAYNATDPLNPLKLPVIEGTTSSYEIEVTGSGTAIKFVNDGDGSWLHDDCWCRNVFEKIKTASSGAAGN